MNEIEKCKSQTTIPHTERVRYYLEQSLSQNTHKAYQDDIAHFTSAGFSIPCLPEDVAAYIATYAGTLSIATLIRRLSGINKAHELMNHPSPTKSEIVRLTIKGIRREHNVKQKQAAPLLRDDLIAILNMLPADIRGIRDRAALMVGFTAALRRSELIALNVGDIEFVMEGMIVTIQQSKTDQDGLGRKIAIPRGRTRYCPVESVENWIENLPKENAPFLRSIRKGGHIQQERLSDSAISCMVKEHVAKIGLDPKQYSGHSLRAGCVTSLAQMGIPEWQIMKQSGHKSHATMMRYVRDARLFEDHPLEGLF